MQNLNLNDLMRYGFAGAIFIFVLLIAFTEPRLVFLDKDISGAAAAAFTAAAFSLGCVIYAFHRAVFFPPLYLLFKSLTGREESTIDLDIQRWKNLSKANSLQPRLGDWAAQVHFLYCITWASIIAILYGVASNLTVTGAYSACKITSTAFLLSSLVHHYRYQRWEKRVFKEDRGITK